MWIIYNPNPKRLRVGDCTVRALSKALNQSWETTYIELCLQGLVDCDIPSANHVWGNYLKAHGFERNIIPTECPECYTVHDFCKDHPSGIYVCAISGHVVAIENGNYFDSFDSGDMTPLYYWSKKGD